MQRRHNVATSPEIMVNNFRSRHHRNATNIETDPLMLLPAVLRGGQNRSDVVISSVIPVHYNCNKNTKKN